MIDGKKTESEPSNKGDGTKKNVEFTIVNGGHEHDLRDAGPILGMNQTGEPKRVRVQTKRCLQSSESPGVKVVDVEMACLKREDTPMTAIVDGNYMITNDLNIEYIHVCLYIFQGFDEKDDQPPFLILVFLFF